MRLLCRLGRHCWHSEGWIDRVTKQHGASRSPDMIRCLKMACCWCDKKKVVDFSPSIGLDTLLILLLIFGVPLALIGITFIWI